MSASVKDFMCGVEWNCIRKRISSDISIKANQFSDKDPLDSSLETSEVAPGAPAATLASQMEYLDRRHIPTSIDKFKLAPRDGKTHGIGLLETRAGSEDKLPATSAASSPASSPPTSPSADKTDNRDQLSFCPAPTTFCESPPSPDMRREDERLKTFAKWPVPFLRPQDLAKSGFYYLGRGDEVRCAFCKVEIMRWEEGDDPAVDHERWAPQCPLLRRYPTGNVPMSSNGAVDGRDECGVRAPPSPGNEVSGAVRAPGPANPRYASESARLRSFKDWPRSLKQKPEELADAGFFYTGQGDKTKCFYCDGGLKDWEECDVPWEQHARWFDRCAFVQLVKGRDYVQKVMTEHAQIGPEESTGRALARAPQPEPATPARHEERERAAPLEDSKLCKICFVEERNVCFVPCGHVVACAKCALATDKCPMCRRIFTSAVRLYYS